MGKDSRFFKLFSTFSTPFFQKKIKQFNVEFAVDTVPDQTLDTIALSDVDFSTILNAIEKNVGVYNILYINTRQTTANKQVLMFFKLTLEVDSLGDAVLSRRIFLEILNNL
jgi:hypothetical protein